MRCAGCCPWTPSKSGASNAPLILPAAGCALLERRRLHVEPRRVHNEHVPTVVVRDLPAKVHAELVRRAEASGQSLQQYLTGELTRLTLSSTVDQVLKRISARRGGTVGLRRAVADLGRQRRQK